MISATVAVERNLKSATAYKLTLLLIMNDRVLQVGVKVLIKNSDNKYLFLKRSLVTYPETTGNNLDIPGGRIEIGTPLIENLQREVSEETGLTLDIASLKLLAAQDIIRAEKHVVRLTYTGTATGDIVLDPKEHESFEWIDLSDLKEKKELDKYTKEVLSLL